MTASTFSSLPSQAQEKNAENTQSGGEKNGQATASDCPYALPAIRTALDSFYASFGDDDDEVPLGWLSLEELEPEDCDDFEGVGPGPAPVAIEEWKSYANAPVQSEQRIRLPYKKKPICAKLRWRIFMRDRYQCRRCLSPEDLTVDHIVAEVNGGEATIDNLQTLCRPCNSRKGAR